MTVILQSGKSIDRNLCYLSVWHGQWIGCCVVARFGSKYPWKPITYAI